MYFEVVLVRRLLKVEEAEERYDDGMVGGQSLVWGPLVYIFERTPYHDRSEGRLL